MRTYWNIGGNMYSNGWQTCVNFEVKINKSNYTSITRVFVWLTKYII